jgi:BioD-like phosphotransacetylase family protein
MAEKKGVYIAGAEQHAGKTFLTIGMLAYLNDKLPNGAGYFKPLGQKVQEVDGESTGQDSYFVNKILNLGLNLSDAAPFSTGSGAAKKYLISGEPVNIIRTIQKAYQRMIKKYDFLVVEGTGHPGVGAVFNLSNGRIARKLKTPVILVIDGGVGSTIDRYALCSSVFKNSNAKIIGVVLNKIIPDKVDKIKKLVTPWFEKQGLKVFGYIPYQKTISEPSMRGLAFDLKLNVHYENENISKVIGFIMGNGRVDEIYEKLTRKTQSALLLSAKRKNIIEMIVTRRIAESLKDSPGALILCGEEEIEDWIIKACEKVSLPLYSSPVRLSDMIRRLNRKTFKVSVEESVKVKEIIKLVSEHVDIDSIYETVVQPPDQEAVEKRDFLLSGVIKKSVRVFKNIFVK